MPHDGFPYADENTPGNFAYKSKEPPLPGAFRTLGKEDGADSDAPAVTTEKVALEYVELAGRLAAVVEWCVTNEGETLGDNPQQHAYAKRVLAEAKAKRGE